jgi:hypothetical protein
MLLVARTPRFAKQGVRYRQQASSEWKTQQRRAMAQSACTSRSQEIENINRGFFDKGARGTAHQKQNPAAMTGLSFFVACWDFRFVLTKMRSVW